jgi:pimeloyl-ACP methyl ester carboxylesterase
MSNATQGEYIERPDGTRLFSVSAGSGPAVVLAHGYLLDHTIFTEIGAQLVAAGRRVIAFDQRGHGRSTIGADGLGPAALASDYRALLEHYAVQDGTLVAHSMGGFLSVVFCLEHAEAARKHLQRLVLLGANAGAVARGSAQNRLQTPLLKSGVLRRLWQLPGVGSALVRQLFGAQPDPRRVEQTRQILLAQRVRETWPMLNAMLDDDLYPRLGEIGVPALVLCGTHDRTCPAWHSRELAARIPGSRGLWLEGKGHMLSFEAEDAIVECVLAAQPSAGDVLQQPL